MARPWNFDFLLSEYTYDEKLGYILKLLVPKFRSDLSARLKDMVEKQLPKKLKPMVNMRNNDTLWG